LSAVMVKCEMVKLKSLSRISGGRAERSLVNEVSNRQSRCR